MVEFLAAIAVVNCLLGFAFALYWEHLTAPIFPPAPKRAPLPRRRRPAAAPPIPSPLELADEPPATPAARILEAAQGALRLDIEGYRDQLTAAEDQVRSSFDDLDPQGLWALSRKVLEANRQWLAQQTEALGALMSREATEERLESLARTLENSLLAQTAQIEVACGFIEGLEFAPESAERDARALGVYLSRLIELSHLLRDAVRQTLASAASAAGAAESLPAPARLDPLTGLSNRAGIEAALAAWRRESAGASASWLLLDVDRCGALNAAHGAQGGDQILAGLARRLEGLTRKLRGCDHLARFEADSFLLFLGGADPSEAACAAERLREGIASAELVCRDGTVQVTVSVGVAHSEDEEPSEAVYHRLRRAAGAAKEAGGNQCWLDAGGELTLVAPACEPSLP